MVNLNNLATAATLLAIAPSCTAANRCPLTGPVFRRPTSLGSSPDVKSAGQELTKKLDDAVAGSIQAGWAVKNTSFSLALVSLSREAPIWEYHHLSPANKRGTKSLDGDTQYLIGSVSKVFTDLLVLKAGVSVNDRVTKYLPLLNAPKTPINWDQVTLGSLADHTSGTPQYFGFPEIYDLVPYYEQLGFPKLKKSDFPPCGVIGLHPGCTKNELLKNMRWSHPVSAPFLRPVYSSISFTLLAYALQNATGLSYDELLDKHIVKPMEMVNTGVSPGNTSRAVVPNGPSSWGANYGANAADGGLYSSINDLSKLMHGILSYSTKILPTSSAVRNWLHPHSTTGSSENLIGAPWEIYRPSGPKFFPEGVTPRTLTITAKDGGAQGYIARFAMLQEYGVGFVLLTAGATGTTAVNVLSDAMLAEFVPAIEAATRQEAEDAYVGTFRSSPSSSSTSTGGDDEIIPASGTLKISMDGGPGLILAKFTRDGSDILDGIRTIFSSQLVSMGNLGREYRLYPTNVYKKSTMPSPDGRSGTVDVVEEDWRLSLEPEPVAPKTELPSTAGPGDDGLGVFQRWCTSWQTQDALYYGGNPVDRFVVLREAKTGGKVLGVKSPALRMAYWR